MTVEIDIAIDGNSVCIQYMHGLIEVHDSGVIAAAADNRVRKFKTLKEAVLWMEERSNDVLNGGRGCIYTVWGAYWYAV